MAKVRWHVITSVDGFIAAPGDDMRWIFEVFGESATVDHVIETTGAIVMGRRTYEVEDRDRPGIYGGAWNGPYFVVTHTVPTSIPPWMTGTFVTTGIEDAVTRAKAAAGDSYVGLLGGNMAQQCLAAGHLDELVVQIAPVLLGDGIRFFDMPGVAKIKLEKRSVRESGKLTDLHFNVLK
jgi:dihydrofolate reductase